MTEEQQRRYEAAAHAVQAGTKMGETSAMDCRIGLNIQMAEFAAFGELLMAKGLITEEEYCEAMITGLEREKARMEKALSRGGMKITLV